MITGLLVLGVIGVFFILVVVHELGHYLVARFFDIKVLKFSIGFGRSLSVIRKFGTDFVIGWLPLGGYVQLLDSREQKDLSETDKAHAIDLQPIWIRALVYAVGPFMNIVLAFFSFWLMFAIGHVVVPAKIGEVLPDTPAAEAQLAAGDRIMKVNQHSASDWLLANIYLIESIGNDTLTLDIKKPSGEAQIIELDLKDWQLDPVTMDIFSSLGFKPIKKKDIEIHDYSIVESIGAAIERVMIYLKFNFKVLYKLFHGDISIYSLLGPIGLVSVTYLVLQQSISIALNFLGIVSMAIAFVNLLPIPTLDGGQLLYLAIEKFTGKPVSIAVQILCYRLVMIFFCLLLLQLLLNDAMRIAVAYAA